MVNSIQRIIFIGYMGAGKSHVASQLAEVTGRKAVDLDAAVESIMGLSIHEAFERHGESFFREQESMVLRAVLSDSSVEILACGGGTPCQNGNAALIQKSGYVVYLNPPLATLRNRLGNSKNRPLLDFLAETDDELKLEKHLESRMIYYSNHDERLEDAVSEGDLLRWSSLLKA